MATSIRPRQKGGSSHSGGPPRVPFEHMTRLVTKGGIGLHSLPGPLDKWISREVRKQDGEWIDSKTGRPLNADEKGEFEQHRRQLARRTRVGRNADKLARIVERYLPDLANEARCYMIRYPHEVKKLLKQARRIRRRIKARMARGTAADQRKKPRKTKPETRQPREKADDNKTTPHTTTDAGESAHRTPANAEGNDDEPEAVDWGSDESEHKAPKKDEMEEPHTANAEGGAATNMLAKGSEMEEPHTASAEGGAATNMPAKGSDDDDEHDGEEGSGSRGAQRPRTPSRSPRRRPLQLKPRLGAQRPEHPAGAQHEDRGQCSPACVVKCNKYKNT